MAHLGLPLGVGAGAAKSGIGECHENDASPGETVCGSGHAQEGSMEAHMSHNLRNVKHLGQGLTEYVILVGIVGVLLIPAVKRFGGSNAEAYTASAHRIETLTGGAGFPSNGGAGQPVASGTGGLPGGAGNGGPGGPGGPGGVGGSGSPGASGSGPLANAHGSAAMATHHHKPAGGQPGSGTMPTTGGTMPTTGGSTTGTTTGGTTPPTPPAPHSVSLAWDPSPSADVTGYNIYRSLTSGGTFQKINATPVVPSAYKDTAVTAGTTYYYKTTAVDAAGAESAFSNEVSTTIP
jgi:hypothetical protein